MMAAVTWLGRLHSDLGGDVTDPSAEQRTTATAAHIRPPVGLIRSRLLSAADQVTDHRLVLVVAPAGSGKSTLLGQFRARTKARTVAYVVDASDRRADVLLAGLERAFRDSGACGSEAEPWTSPDAALRGIAKAASASAPDGIVVVLDDLHSIEGSEALVCLHHLFTRLPEGVTALVGSRQVPNLDLSRLRLADQLVEITADDLRFRSWEIEELFSSHYGTRLPPAELARLARATDGWAAGLKLFHLATSNRTDQERRSELDRLAKSRAPTVREYLTQNVLAGLPPDTRQFLVRTSVLGHLTPAICDELLGRTRSVVVLEELARQQLFTETNGDDQFRYHEVLRGHLESVLADELEPCALQAWYLRAAIALEAHGATGDAVRAYVCADDIEGAARVLGDASDLLSGPDAWIERLPVGLFAEDAWVQLVHARRLLREGRPEAAWRAFRTVDDRSSGGTAGRLAQREAEQLHRWVDPAERPAQDGDWLSLLRSGLRRDPSAVRLICSRIAGPEAAVAAGLAALLDGDPTLASRLLGGSWGEPATGLVGDIATAARAVADWLGQGIDPSPILSRVRDQADRHRHEWLARILRAVLLAVPRFDDGPFEVLTVTVEKSATDSGDQWCIAVAALFGGLGRALDEAHPLEPAAAIGRLDDAGARFASLGAEVLAAWAQAAAMALLVDSQAPRDAVRERSLRTALGTTRLTNSSFVCAPALAPRVDPHVDAATVPTGTTTLRSWIAQAAQLTAGATAEHRVAPVAQVRCFGALTLRFDGLDLDLAVLKPRPRSLLRYLAVRAGRWVHRDELIESLWPQLSAVTATNSLHVALTAIRNALGVHSVLLRRNGETYCFEACDDHDLRAFEKLIDQAGAARRAGDTVSARSIGEQALALYRDDLLADEGAGEWAVALRAQYRRTFVLACESLAVGHLRAGDDLAAAIVARRGLACDRYSDGLWRALQDALTGAGLQAESARAEGEYRAVLLELGLASAPVAGGASRSSSAADAAIVSAADAAIVSATEDGLVLGVRSR